MATYMIRDTYHGEAVTEYVCPPKKRMLDKASGESTSFATRPYPRYFDANDDECIRQYILFYYQFHKSDGFVIDWNKLEYRFETTPLIEPYRFCTRTNDEVICDSACRLLVKYNAVNGTRLVYLDHVSASFRRCGGVLYYITFRALDLALSSPEPKIYQAKFRLSGTLCEIYIFRLKPTDEEIAAVQVDPPPPLYEDDPEEPTILFTVTGPGSGSIPDVVFTRIPAEVSVTSPNC